MYVYIVGNFFLWKGLECHLIIIIIIGYTLSVSLAAASGLVGHVGLRVGSGAFFRVNAGIAAVEPVEMLTD